MRIARARIQGTARTVVEQDGVARVAPEGVGVLDAIERGASADWPTVDREGLDLAAPVDRPGKMIAVGLNYADHTSETGFTQPERPLTFAKYTTSITGPYDDIVVPAHLTEQVDYEAELTLLIGRRCGGATPATIDDIAGYTVANDVSARDVQFADVQWSRGKSFDSFTPLGPWLVTPDEFGAQAGHRIHTSVNGEVLQDDDTGGMIFDIPAILAFVSDGVTLEPGDLILTGTPAGAGAFRVPARYLQDGDLVVCGVEGIGELRNRVVRRATAAA